MVKNYVFHALVLHKQSNQIQYIKTAYMGEAIAQAKERLIVDARNRGLVVLTLLTDAQIAKQVERDANGEFNL